MPLSPNMNLPIPVPSQTGGPQYALDEQSCFNQIDSHNHTPGQGVQIPVNALDINQNLSMSDLSVTDLKSVKFSDQAITPGVSSIYMLSGNLWYTNSSGDDIQLTNGSTINISGQYGFTGLPSGTASAAFLPGSATFRFQSATNIAATTDIGPIKLRNTTALSNAITLTPPNPLPADYTLTFPSALPAVGTTGFIECNDTGNLSFTTTSGLIPVGSLMPFAGTSAPSGYLFCNGGVYATAAYPALFAVIGSTYNDGTEVLGTFRVPDLRSKNLVGAGTGTITETVAPQTAFVYNPIPGQFYYFVTVNPNFDCWKTGDEVVISNNTFTGTCGNGTRYAVRFGNNNNYVGFSLSRDPYYDAQGSLDSSASLTLLGTGSLTITKTLQTRTVGQQYGSDSTFISYNYFPNHNHTTDGRASYLGGVAPYALSLTQISGTSGAGGATGFGDGAGYPLRTAAPTLAMNYIIKY